ncbi:hypothetical protein AB205_0034210 [Aquarana catesbeiana]|uniref:BPTI/Kunitz inhibitor domain-containing protein n=1 Tax=Aquarana catesbeiana TaxID=8400 RepID=A0A2G9RMD3_AQUCT|nr:hypothetical protein AB205_0034210 [Aquarana catesbeiana]
MLNAIPSFLLSGSCRLHPGPGPCSANITRYFYNTSSMACESFQYGGCIGNHNNFNTEQECIQTCRTKGWYTLMWLQHSAIMNQLTYSGWSREAGEPLSGLYCHQIAYVCWRVFSSLPVLATGTGSDEEISPKLTKHLFWVLADIQFSLVAACRIPIATGSCNTSETRWAFEENQSKCVTFQYGGCKGNSNHFYTEKECKDFCEVLIGGW